MSKESSKKILVGCCTADVKAYCLNQYLAGIRKITYPHDVLFVDNSQTDEYSKKIAKYGFPVERTEHCKLAAESLTISMNFLRKKALEYDYLLILEQDVIPPPNIIELLLESNKDIVAAAVPHLLVKNQKKKEIALLGVDDKNHPGKYIYFNWASVLEHEGVIPVQYCGTACILLSKKASEQIEFRYEETEHTKKNPNDLHWQDICLCKDAKKLNIPIYAKLGAKCKHVFYGGYCATLGSTKNIKL